MLTNPAPAKPGARALYLGARDKKHVSCTAEALVVRNEQRQTRRYPLARVSRIVSSTVTDWSGSALALCLKSGISITWMDAAGHPLGSCYPAQRHYPSFVTAIELLTENADGLMRYQHWLRSRRMDMLIRWSKTQTDPIDPVLWENTKREWVYGQHIAAHLPTALRGHCLAWVGAQLAVHGLHPELWGPQAEPIHLDQDLGDLLWAEMNLGTGSLADAAHAGETSASLFERWNSVNGSVLMLHLTSLCRTAMKALTPAPLP